jgi:hypothetical protein
LNHTIILFSILSIGYTGYNARQGNVGNRSGSSSGSLKDNGNFVESGVRTKPAMRRV